MIKHRCEVNIAGPEEDCGLRVTYVPCNRPASWYTEDERVIGPMGLHLCEHHQIELSQRTDDDVEFAPVSK